MEISKIILNFHLLIFQKTNFLCKNQQISFRKGKMLFRIENNKIKKSNDIISS